MRGKSLLKFDLQSRKKQASWLLFLFTHYQKKSRFRKSKAAFPKFNTYV